MCFGRSKAPEPKKDPIVEQELESQEVIEKEEIKEQKKKALEGQIAKRKGGTGRRSLLTSTGGGIGYYNKYFGTGIGSY